MGLYSQPFGAFAYKVKQSPLNRHPLQYPLHSSGSAAIRWWRTTCVTLRPPSVHQKTSRRNLNVGNLRIQNFGLMAVIQMGDHPREALSNVANR